MWVAIDNILNQLALLWSFISTPIRMQPVFSSALFFMNPLVGGLFVGPFGNLSIVSLLANSLLIIICIRYVMGILRLINPLS